WKEEFNFDSLNITFLHHNEVKGEISVELANGLMAYTGASFNYRTPEKHGARSIPSGDKPAEYPIRNHYSDLNPYVRLEYTPRQYYCYNNSYKQYLASEWPTFTLEAAKGIKGLSRTNSDYTRLEFDVHQSIPLGANRSLSYHAGAGAFFKQKGEYFINYHYFARSQYPTSWEEKIGGTFSLLNDYWYSSSPAYLQWHTMYESPFMLLNKIRKISKYVIKERIYLSHLIADGKSFYTEFGYGMGNNYFNVGMFGSMIGFRMSNLGVKFTIEFDQHL
ncbi:MAG: DUF5686 family protein, partial [Bacteroidales bacterium]|nr:DUF5686 family protein [Bacteroidales bacterium]